MNVERITAGAPIFKVGERLRNRHGRLCVIVAGPYLQASGVTYDIALEEAAPVPTWWRRAWRFLLRWYIRHQEWFTAALRRWEGRS